MPKAFGSFHAWRLNIRWISFQVALNRMQRREFRPYFSYQTAYQSVHIVQTGTQTQSPVSDKSMMPFWGRMEELSKKKWIHFHSRWCLITNARLHQFIGPILEFHAKNENEFNAILFARKQRMNHQKWNLIFVPSLSLQSGSKRQWISFVDMRIFRLNSLIRYAAKHELDDVDDYYCEYKITAKPTRESERASSRNHLNLLTKSNKAVSCVKFNATHNAMMWNEMSLCSHNK